MIPFTNCERAVRWDMQQARLATEMCQRLLQHIESGNEREFREELSRSLTTGCGSAAIARRLINTVYPGPLDEWYCRTQATN